MNGALGVIRVFGGGSSSVVGSSSRGGPSSKNGSGVPRSLIRIFRVVYARVCVVEMRMF